MRTRSSSAALLAVAAALLCAGCGGSAVAPGQAVRPASGGVLRYVLTDDPRSVTPLGARTADEMTVERSIFAGLYDTDPGGAGAVPVIARSATVSHDRRTVTIRLRSGVKFTDGEPVTAETFARDWAIVCATGAPAAPLLRMVEGCEGADPSVALAGADPVAADRLVVHLTAPFADLAAVLANPGTWAFPPDQAATDADRAAFEQHPVGCGGFRLVRWTPGRLITLARTSPGVHLAGVRLTILSGATAVGTAVSRYRSGHQDATPVPAPQLRATMADPALSRQLVIRPLQSVVALLVPPQVVADASVRRALAYAADPVATSASSPAGTPADGIIPVSTPGYVPGAQPWAYDPASAATLLAGKQVAPLRIVSADPSLDLVASALVTGFRAVGLRAAVASGRAPGALRVVRLTAAYPSADAIVGPLAIEPAARVLVRKARATGDPQHREELQRAAAVEEMRSATVIPLTFAGRAVLVSPRVAGAVFDAAGLPHFDRWGWVQSQQ